MEDDNIIKSSLADVEKEESGIGSAISKIYGGATTLGSYVVPSAPDVWPDMDKVDEMVKVITYAGYALLSFGAIGSVYFALKTTRELSQWRSWMKYRKIWKRG